METNVKEVRKRAKVAVPVDEDVEDVVETETEEMTEAEASEAQKKKPSEKIKYGFHKSLVVLSRIIGGFQSLYQNLFIVDEKAVGSDFHKEHGFSAFEKGNYSKAVEHFLCANKEKGGKDAEVLFYLGLSFAQQEEYAKAIGFLKRAEALKENDADVVSEIGNCLVKLEQYAEAIEYLKKAIDLSPEIASLFYALGTAYDKTGKLEEAIESYNRAIELEPRAPLYYHALGFAYESSGKHPDAIACFKKAMEFEKHHKLNE